MTATVILNHHGSFLTVNAVGLFGSHHPAQTVTLAHAACERGLTTGEVAN